MDHTTTVSVTRIVPYAHGTNPAASQKFYTGLLGLKTSMRDPVLGLVSPANPTAQIIIEPPGTRNPQPSFGVDVGDPAAVDAVHAAVLEHNVRVVYAIRDEPWGVRRFFVEDPGGTIINVLAHLT